MKAQQEEAKLSFQQTLLNAGAEVNNALTQYQNARAKTDLRINQIEAMAAPWRAPNCSCSTARRPISRC